MIVHSIKILGAELPKLQKNDLLLLQDQKCSIQTLFSGFNRSPDLKINLTYYLHVNFKPLILLCLCNYNGQSWLNFFPAKILRSQNPYWV